MREDAVGKLALEVEDLGTPELKNIAQRYRVFRVRLGAPERPALPLPDKPSIAVLPFQNMSGDPEQEYFADGIVEDIIAALSRTRLAVRHRAQFELRVQGQVAGRPRGRARTWRALRAGRQRAQGSQPRADRGTVGGCDERRTRLGRAV